MTAVAHAGRAPVVRRTTRRDWLLAGAGVPMLGLLIVPLVAMVLKIPPQVLLGYLSDAATRQAIALSLTTSTAATIAVVILGMPIAYLLARRRPSFGHILDAIIDLPTVLPPAVAGLALLIAFGRRGLLGGMLNSLGIDVAFTTVAVVMAQAFVSAPYFIKAATLGLASVSQELEQAAALDGASSPKIFRYIMLPLAWRGLLGGLTLCWARSLGEFGATIIFAGNYPGRTETMPLAVYVSWETDLNQALTLATILLAISFVILFAVRGTLRSTEPES